jgi:hypothetical protein
MKHDASELDRAVAELGITLCATHIQCVMHPKTTNQDKWAHDAWEITLSYQGREMTTSYRTGLGHRTKYPNVTKHGEVYGGPLGNARGIEKATAMGYTKPVTPSVGDVVYSLVMDASCSDYTFNDWCSEFGYDTDSRKALDTYLQCQENSVKVRKLLTATTYNSLTGLEH